MCTIPSSSAHGGYGRAFASWPCGPRRAGRLRRPRPRDRRANARARVSRQQRRRRAARAVEVPGSGGGIPERAHHRSVAGHRTLQPGSCAVVRAGPRRRRPGGDRRLEPHGERAPAGVRPRPRRPCAEPERRRPAVLREGSPGRFRRRRRQCQPGADRPRGSPVPGGRERAAADRCQRALPRDRVVRPRPRADAQRESRGGPATASARAGSSARELRRHVWDRLSRTGALRRGYRVYRRRTGTG